MSDLSKLASSPIVASIFTQIIIPNLVAFISKIVDSSGKMPTEEEIILHLNDTCDHIMSTGEAFKRLKGV